LNDRPRIVFVSLVFHPDTSAASQLFTDLPTRLAERGSRVTVLCGFPTKDVRPDARSLPRYEEYRSVHILRCGLRIEGKQNVAARALAYAGFLAHAGWRLLRSGRLARMLLLQLQPEPVKAAVRAGGWRACFDLGLSFTPATNYFDGRVEPRPAAPLSFKNSYYCHGLLDECECMAHALFLDS